MKVKVRGLFKYLWNSKLCNSTLVLLFILLFSLSGANDHYQMARTISYLPIEESFDHYDISRPSRRRGIILFEGGEEKSSIAASKSVPLAVLIESKGVGGVATYVLEPYGISNPSKRLVKIEFIDGKAFGNTIGLDKRRAHYLYETKRLFLVLIAVFVICLIILGYFSIKYILKEKGNE